MLIFNLQIKIVLNRTSMTDTQGHFLLLPGRIIINIKMYKTFIVRNLTFQIKKTLNHKEPTDTFFTLSSVMWETCFVVFFKIDAA